MALVDTVTIWLKAAKRTIPDGEKATLRFGWIGEKEADDGEEDRERCEAVTVLEHVKMPNDALLFLRSSLLRES